MAEEQLELDLPGITLLGTPKVIKKRKPRTKTVGQLKLPRPKTRKPLTPERRRELLKSIEHARAVRASNEFQNTPITLDLRKRHYINGNPYGPGLITVPQSIASTLEAQEQGIRRVMARDHEAHAYIINKRGAGGMGATEVHPDHFDASFTRSIIS